MKTWDTNTEWFVIKCEDRDRVTEFLNFSGILITWEAGIEHFIGSENLVISNSIGEFIVLGGDSIMDLAFESFDEYMFYKDHGERLNQMVKFLNKLSANFGEAYFFQTHDHHMINIGLFKSKNGELVYGKAIVDGDNYDFAGKEKLEIDNEKIFNSIESWTFNPMKIEQELDTSKLNWIEKEHKPFVTQAIKYILSK